MAQAIKITEDEFARQVIELAQYTGWRVAHFRPARVTIKGRETWRTPVQADGAGFPDLVLARKGRLIFAELKADKAQPTSEQTAWYEALEETGKCEVYEWRPSQWELIELTLRREV